MGQHEVDHPPTDAGVGDGCREAGAGGPHHLRAEVLGVGQRIGHILRERRGAGGLDRVDAAAIGHWSSRSSSTIRAT
jgi:hypothetical protein